MKVVKGIIYFVLLMLSAVLLAALFAPSNKTVSRTIDISAPQKKVFSQVANFENWKKWDAWFAKDTSQVRTYYGTVNDKKQGYTWSSENSDVGEGRMEMNEIRGLEELNYTFYFEERPSKGSFKLMENGDKTEVVWEMYSELGYPFKLLNYFIDPMVGPDFEVGLSNLKNLVESMPKELASEGSVEIESELNVNYVLVKGNDIPFGQVDGFLSEAYRKIYGYTSTNGLSPKGPPRALYYKWDEVSDVATLAAAVPIAGISREEERPMNIGVGESVYTREYIACEYKGGPIKGYEVHGAMSKWIEDNRKELRNPAIEEYIKGYQETADTSLHQTRVYYYYE